MTENNSSYEAWLKAHIPQLKAIGLPEQLWGRLHHKVSNGIFDAGQAFLFERDDEVTDRCLKWSVHSIADLKAAGDVWLVDHAWEFDSCRDARFQLIRDPAVRARVACLLELEPEELGTEPNIDEATDTDVVRGGGADRKDAFGALLFSEMARFAHPFVVDGKVRYCVLDEFGSRIQQADDPGFSCQVFADLVRGEFISLLWPMQATLEGAEVTKPAQKSLEVMEDGMRYWDQRFMEEVTFDWFCGSEDVTDKLKRYCTISDRVMVPGCGNSQLSFDLDAAGFHNVVSTDFSKVAVDKMRSLYPHLEYALEDCTSMKGRENGSFQAVVDKGLLDSLLQKPCVDRVDESDTWLLPKECKEDADAVRYLHEVHRVLAPNGIFVLASLGSQTNRVPFFSGSSSSHFTKNQGVETSHPRISGSEVLPLDHNGGDDEHAGLSWEVLEICEIKQSVGQNASGSDHGTEVHFYVVAKR